MQGLRLLRQVKKPVVKLSDLKPRQKTYVLLYKPEA